MQQIQKELFAMQDIGYKEFHQRLVPTLNPDVIIGVRTPHLRAFAKKFSKTPEHATFLKELPHVYYEENNLHAYLIEQIKDYETALKETERFLPWIDNWATCDTFLPKTFKKHKHQLLPTAKQWLQSEHTYTVRYGIGVLMHLFLNEDFSPEYLKLVAAIKSEEYYINMMIAWYFATAFVKQYDAAIPFLTEHRLPVWVHNKTIQKAVESYRISAEIKLYLKTLKISMK
ncbi:MAG: DNA alkylation repair protein [Clostridia bacterium]|nr:DNA alkylation repair protein [Clostridia bacterium]